MRRMQSMASFWLKLESSGNHFLTVWKDLSPSADNKNEAIGSIRCIVHSRLRNLIYKILLKYSIWDIRRSEGTERRTKRRQQKFEISLINQHKRQYESLFLFGFKFELYTFAFWFFVLFSVVTRILPPLLRVCTHTCTQVHHIKIKWRTQLILSMGSRDLKVNSKVNG